MDRPLDAPLLTEPAPHAFWQNLEAVGTAPAEVEGYRDVYPAVLPDGRWLALPVRVLPGDGSRAVASLIANQAAFAVEDALVSAMADLAQPYRPEVVIGLPTLGLTLAAGLARRLGHPRWVPLGTSRKFWYREDLSEPLASITTPGGGKRLYVDPRMLPVLEGRRVVLVDDVVSSGASLATALGLLHRLDVRPVAVVVAMTQTERWRTRLADTIPDAPPVLGVLASPLLVRGADGRWRGETGGTSG